MTRRLSEIAQLVRSKNAGPFWLTFDVMFSDPEIYRQVKAANVLTYSTISALYPRCAEHLKVFDCDAALAIKFSFPRIYPSGSMMDSDVFGGQQYSPLLDIEVEIEFNE